MVIFGSAAGYLRSVLVFAALLMGFAAVLVRVAKPMAAGQSSALRLALANLRRRLWPNAFQLITFSLALFLTTVAVFFTLRAAGPMATAGA